MGSARLVLGFMLSSPLDIGACRGDWCAEPKPEATYTFHGPAGGPTTRACTGRIAPNSRMRSGAAIDAARYLGRLPPEMPARGLPTDATTLSNHRAIGSHRVGRKARSVPGTLHG